MSVLAGLLFLWLAVGIGRLLLPSRTVLERSRMEEMALAYLLGTAAVMITCTAGLALGIPFGLLWWLPLVAGLGAWVLEIRRRELRGPFAASPFSRPVAILLAVLAIGSIAATLALPLNEFDPIYHFGYRGQVLLYEGSATAEAITGMIQPDGFGRLVTHPNYPFGVPILEAWVAKLGGWDGRWVQFPLSLWTACLPLVLAFGLRLRGARAASWTAMIAAVTPMLYGADYLKHGWADLSRAGLAGEMMLGAGGDVGIACLLGAALALWLRLRKNGGWHAMALVALCLVGTAHLKNEGMALSACTLLALLLGQALPSPKALAGRLMPMLRLGALVVLLVSPWIFLRAQLPAIDENYTERLTVSNVMHFWSAEELQDKSPQAAAGKTADPDLVEKRRDLVASSFLEEFLDWRSWGLLWLLFFCSLPVTRRRLADVELRQLTLLVLGAGLLYFLILLVTPWNFPSLRDKGIPERLLVHLVGVMALAIGVAMSPALGPGPKEES